MDNLLEQDETMSTPRGSKLALGGLLWGVGVLDAAEVLRYLDATFQDLREIEKGRTE